MRPGVSTPQSNHLPFCPRLRKGFQVRENGKYQSMAFGRFSKTVKTTEYTEHTEYGTHRFQDIHHEPQPKG